MQYRLLPSLVVALAAAVVPSSPSWADDGGGVASPTGSGGTVVGHLPKVRRHRRHRGPVITGFSLSRQKLFLYGHPARIRFRIKRGPARVSLRLAGPTTASIPLGRLRSGHHSFLLTGRETGVLPQGSYTVRIAGRRGAKASSSAALSFFHHRFPIAGPFSYGSGFGAERPGHSHQGQDLPAAEGTPVVAPRGGTIEAVQYQKGGAGHYVVLDGRGETRDYVFMHLRSGSVVVAQGQQVRTGQRIGEVGSTGESTGPHLHFEIWDGPWYAGGHPIDPLPLLRACDAWS